MSSAKKRAVSGGILRFSILHGLAMGVFRELWLCDSDLHDRFRELGMFSMLWVCGNCGYLVVFTCNGLVGIWVS